MEAAFDKFFFIDETKLVESLIEGPQNTCRGPMIQWEKEEEEAKKRGCGQRWWVAGVVGVVMLGMGKGKEKEVGGGEKEFVIIFIRKLQLQLFLL